MAFEKQQVVDSINTFIKNPFWEEKFSKATPGAKKRLSLSFFFSEHGNDEGFDLDAYRNLREHIESALSREDLQFLIDNDSNEAAKKHFQELLDKMTNDIGADASKS